MIELYDADQQRKIGKERTGIEREYRYYSMQKKDTKKSGAVLWQLRFRILFLYRMYSGSLRTGNPAFLPQYHGCVLWRFF